MLKNPKGLKALSLKWTVSWGVGLVQIHSNKCNHTYSSSSRGQRKDKRWTPLVPSQCAEYCIITSASTRINKWKSERIFPPMTHRTSKKQNVSIKEEYWVVQYSGRKRKLFPNVTEVCPNHQSSNGYQRLWVGEKSGAGENCFVSRFTFGNIWLCLITLQIYGRGDNMLTLMILCEEKPRLWAPDQGCGEALWSEAETVCAGSGHWQEVWLFALICQFSGSGHTGKGWGSWPFLDNFMDEYWRKMTHWQRSRRSWKEGLTSPRRNLLICSSDQTSKKSRNEDYLLEGKTGILINH